MAPITIDGTDVSTITIDGQDVSEITADGDVVYTAIPDSGGSHQWDTDEGSGTTLADSIGSLDGTINGPTWTSGVGTGNAYLDYNGTGDTVDFGTGSQSEFSHFINGKGTVGFWVNIDDENDNYMVFGDAWRGDPSVALINNNGQWRVLVTNSAGEDVVNFNSGDTNSDVGDWVFVACTLDGANGNMYIARPGNNYSLNSYDSASIANTESVDLSFNAKLGVDQAADRWYFDGGIDLGYTDTTADTQSEIQSFVDDSKGFYQ